MAFDSKKYNIRNSELKANIKELLLQRKRMEKAQNPMIGKKRSSYASNQKTKIKTMRITIFHPALLLDIHSHSFAS